MRACGRACGRAQGGNNRGEPAYAWARTGVCGQELYIYTEGMGRSMEEYGRVG